MNIGIPTEIKDNESRVALTPAGAAALSGDAPSSARLRAATLALPSGSEARFRFSTSVEITPLRNARALIQSASTRRSGTAS